MMGQQSGQMSMVILDITELIPSDYLLRKINHMVSFDFIYDLVAPYYFQMAAHLLTLSEFSKCCWRDTFTASSQNADLSRKPS